MQTVETLLERKLSERLKLRIADLKDGLVLRVKPLDEYRQAVGFILGLTEVLDTMLPESVEEAQQRNR